MHFGDSQGPFRFGISYWSGTNTIIETSFDEYTTEDGDTAGVNLRFQFGSDRRSALDVHVLQIINPEEDELVQRYGAVAEGGDVKIGVGYIHRF